MNTRDTRLNAHRPDLADRRLQGLVEAERFVVGAPMQVIEPLVAVRKSPGPDAMQLTQALLGEGVTVFEECDGWAWVQLEADSYVGYMPRAALGENRPEPNHRVTVPATFLYPTADLKTQPALPVTLNARLSVTGTQGAFLRTDDGRYVFAQHVRPLDHRADDFVAVAQRFLNVPYYWGGKSVHGLDCSGLLQLALEACGHGCPRDSDMQEDRLGTALRINDLDGLRRGDLVFWKGHVGIMLDRTTLLHANGHHMMVVAEPLRDAAARIGAAGSEITSLKRL